jgi:hypothetical protein
MGAIRRLQNTRHSVRGELPAERRCQVWEMADLTVIAERVCLHASEVSLLKSKWDWLLS